jgi:hypothetical protein
VSEERPDVAISTRLLTRIIILLVAIWSLITGVVLVFFQGAAAGALGAGVTDQAGQRLVGAHLLVLTPVYLLIAWHPERYQGILWLPFAGQMAVFFAVGYGILSGNIEFGDGILPVAVAAIFMGLLGFIWISEQRSLAHAQIDEDDSVGWSDDDTGGDENLNRS